MGYEMRFRLLLLLGMLIGAALLAGLWLQNQGGVALPDVLTLGDRAEQGSAEQNLAQNSAQNSLQAGAEDSTPQPNSADAPSGAERTTEAVPGTPTVTATSTPNNTVNVAANRQTGRGALLGAADAVGVAQAQASQEQSGQDQAGQNQAAQSQAGQGGAGQAEDPAAPLQPQARPVNVVVAEPGTLNATRITSVIVEPAQESRIAAGTDGRVVNVLKRKDARVARDEPVVILDTDTLELEEQNTVLEVESARVALQQAQQANREDQARANSGLRSAEVTLNSARQRYTEAQQLYAEGFISLAELTALEAEFIQAETVYNDAQNAVARSVRANSEGLEILRLTLQQAETRLTRIRQALQAATIRAPFAGEIVEMLVEEGESVQGGVPVFLLANTDEQVARFNVPLDVASRIVEQGILYIKYGGLDYGAKVLSQSRVDPETQLVEITARLYGSQTQIPSGVVTQLPYAYKAAEGIILPAGAVQSEVGETFVYVAEGDAEGSVAARQNVEVLAEVEERVAVNGLSEGVRVIHPVPNGVREGSQLVVSESP